MPATAAVSGNHLPTDGATGNNSQTLAKAADSASASDDEDSEDETEYQ